MQLKTDHISPDTVSQIPQSSARLLPGPLPAGSPSIDIFRHKSTLLVHPRLLPAGFQGLSCSIPFQAATPPAWAAAAWALPGAGKDSPFTTESHQGPAVPFPQHWQAHMKGSPASQPTGYSSPLDVAHKLVCQRVLSNRLHLTVRHKTASALLLTSKKCH